MTDLFRRSEADDAPLGLADLDHVVSPLLDSYMQDVIDTLVLVFELETDTAVERVNGYFGQTMLVLGAGAVVSALHLEPIQIAADLAGVSDRPLTGRELDKYSLIERRRVVSTDGRSKTSFR